MDHLWSDLSCNLGEIPTKVALIETETAGRGLLALEDLQRGDVIFEETPFVVGPSQSIGPHFCANCSQPLNMGVLQGKRLMPLLLKKISDFCRSFD